MAFAPATLTALTGDRAWSLVKELIVQGPDHPANFLAVSAVMFALGVFIVVTRRNAVALLMGLEFILNAAALNFVVFSRFPISGAWS